MGSRGTIEYEFDKDLYCRCDERTVDKDLEKNYKIAIISRVIGSGKSRAIYEYITNKCQDKFDSIYIVSMAKFEWKIFLC